MTDFQPIDMQWVVDYVRYHSRCHLLDVVLDVCVGISYRLIR